MRVGLLPKDTLRRTWTAALIACCAAGFNVYSAPAPHTVPDTIAQRVQACTACHGKEGVATNQGYFPRIAGKPAGYLYNQLLNFRDGRRHNASMSRLVENLSDDYLKEIAAYFGGLELPYPAPQVTTAAADALARGRLLVEQGDAARGLPACVQCHGAAMTGVHPAIPGLLGVPKDYLQAQLGAWRTHLRAAQAPDCMRQVAERMSPRDLNDVVDYLATQPVRGAGKPAASLPAPLPIPCGGMTP